MAAAAEETPAAAAGETRVPLGPTPGVKYPIKMDYCPNCSIPFEVRVSPPFAKHFWQYSLIFFLVLRVLPRLRELQEVARAEHAGQVRQPGPGSNQVRRRRRWGWGF